jgi:hypothetical protein
MKEKVKFLFFCMIFVGEVAFSQGKPIDSTLNNNFFSVTHQQVNVYFKNFSPSKTVKKYFILSPVKVPLLPHSAPISGTIPIISNNFYTQNLGFFCKRELQLEKATKIPFKFRLGSVQQCDWMEGKVNSVKYF